MRNILQSFRHIYCIELTSLLSGLSAVIRFTSSAFSKFSQLYSTPSELRNPLIHTHRAIFLPLAVWHQSQSQQVRYSQRPHLIPRYTHDQSHQVQNSLMIFSILPPSIQQNRHRDCRKAIMSSRAKTTKLQGTNFREFLALCK